MFPDSVFWVFQVKRTHKLLASQMPKRPLPRHGVVQLQDDRKEEKTKFQRETRSPKTVMNQNGTDFPVNHFTKVNNQFNCQ